VVHKLYNKDNEARLNFLNWCCHILHDGEIYPTLIPISGKAWFHRSELMNSQSKWFPMLIHKVTSHDVHLGMWCAMSANRITGPIYISWYDKFTVTYYTQKQYFLTSVQLHKKICLLQGRQCKAYTANGSMHCFHSPFSNNQQWIITSLFTRYESIQFLLLRHVKG
jgi:hypothetical protein